MNTSINKKIANYYFQDSLRLVYATALGNILLVVGFLMADSATILTNSYAIISGLTAVLFLIIHKMYNWKNHQVNLIMIVLYFMIFMIEILVCGIPSSSIGVSGRYISKGVMLEFLMALMPYVYVSMRLLLIIPLIRMTYGNYRLSNA